MQAGAAAETVDGVALEVFAGAEGVAERAAALIAAMLAETPVGGCGHSWAPWLPGIGCRPSRYYSCIEHQSGVQRNLLPAGTALPGPRALRGDGLDPNADLRAARGAA